MEFKIVNPDPRYSRVRLIEPAPLGYLHLAADVQAPHRPGPVLRRGREKLQLFGALKWQARQLTELDALKRVTAYDGRAMGETAPRYGQPSCRKPGRSKVMPAADAPPVQSL